MNPVVEHQSDPLVRKGQLTPSASAHLDMIRGLAAITVLISHWRNFFFVDWPAVAHQSGFLAALYFITGFGHQAVIVFFVLSGYLIGGHVLQACRRGTWSWRRYCFDRLTRLGIVLVPALLLCLGLDTIGIRALHGQWLYSGASKIAEMQVPVQRSPLVLAGNLLFLQTIKVPVFGSDFPVWSLANEFWYYVMFPLLALLWFVTSRRKQAIFAVLLLLLLWLLPPWITLGFGIWLMGVGVFLLPPRRRLSSRATACALGLAIAGVLVFLVLERRHYLAVQWSDTLLGVIFTGLLYATVHGALPAGGWYTRVARFVSGSSYTVYLVHFPLFACCLAAIGVRWAPDARHLAAGLGLLIAGYGYGVGVAALFEAQTGRFKQWLRPRLGLV